jgi:hypothetical protein
MKLNMASRTLVAVILIIAAIVAIMPVIVAHTRRLQSMRADLAEVLDQCRARYAAAATHTDTTEADYWTPSLHGEQRPGDPPCGRYRRRNMLAPAAR